MLKKFPKTHITLAAAATVVVTTAALMSPSADVEARRMSYTIDLEQGAALGNPVPINQAIKQPEPAEAAAETAAETAELPAASEVPAVVDAAPTLNWKEFDIKSGETLSSLFKKAGFNDGVMLSVIHGDGEADKLQRLYAGEHIRFGIDDEGSLAAIELQRSLLETLKIEKTDSGFVGETDIREPEARPAFASGVIDGSLYLAARDAGLDDRLTMELAGIFGWDIDFVYDVRKGDSFEVVYEELYVDGEKFNTGRILSARFINRGKENVALLYTDTNGDSDYYTPEGQSMRKAFLRVPINARLSSPFNLQRRHPVLDVVRPHEGTDYAAPPGTPIKAAGNGRVQFAGWKGGYGRTVVLQHGDNISTLYAHMSKLGKGIKNGTRVKQGQTIGHVGSSGMVTGPHLHYEILADGVRTNPMKIKMPSGRKLKGEALEDFQVARAIIDGKFAALETETKFAEAGQ